MKNGPYELVIAPDEYPGRRYRGRYAYAHHVVWWEETGQVVPAGYLLHHKDEDKRRNVFSNLELKERGKHSAEHNKKRTQYSTFQCGWCGKKVSTQTVLVKARLARSAYGTLFCSRRCGALHQHRRCPMT